MIVDMDAGWVGSKSENVEKAFVFKGFFASQEGHEARQENEQHREPGRWEGKREGKPSLRSLEGFGQNGHYVSGVLYTPRGTRPRRITFTTQHHVLADLTHRGPRP